MSICLSVGRLGSIRTKAADEKSTWLLVYLNTHTRGVEYVQSSIPRFLVMRSFVYSRAVTAISARAPVNTLTPTTWRLMRGTVVFGVTCVPFRGFEDSVRSRQARCWTVIMSASPWARRQRDSICFVEKHVLDQVDRRNGRFVDWPSLQTKMTFFGCLSDQSRARLSATLARVHCSIGEGGDGRRKLHAGRWRGLSSHCERRQLGNRSGIRTRRPCGSLLMTD